MAERALSSRRTRDLAAQAWADVCDLLDLQLSPLGLRAMAALSPKEGEVIVDIGCGAGQTILQLADRIGPAGQVIGVDISRVLLDVARRRAGGLSHVSFVEGDAQTIDMPDGSAHGLFSRFGVMAFADPAAAFRNFRRILKPSGRLAFVCWRALEENELDWFPLRAARLQHMADATPFSFADREHVRATLGAAGFAQVAIEAYDEPVSSGDVEAMTRVLLRVGPLGKIVRENPDLRADAEPRVRAALAAKADGSAVALRAATWIVTANA